MARPQNGVAMMSLNGLVVRKPDRQSPTCDYDLTPRQLRRYVNASGAQDVQIGNGLRSGVGSGKVMGYQGEGWLNLAQPIIPGQTRGDVGGFHPRGPSPYNFSNVWQAGPGSQPANPGGPGRIAAPTFINPMSG
jgi:hypothetical protein